jgi:hypothetical protein
VTISNEAIEAGARAMDTRALPRDNATAALTAAAPIIRAEALREAADALDAQRDASNHEATPDDRESVRDHNAGRFLGKTVASRLLRARADQIDGGNK